MPENIRVGTKYRYGGQDPTHGISYSTTGTVEIGDIVGPTAAGGTVSRPAAGGLFLGLVISKGRDGGVGVRTNLVHVVRTTGTALTPGIQDLAADGAGGVKSVATGAGIRCNVIGIQMDQGDTLVAFHTI
jgi:hypothetical protein